MEPGAYQGLSPTPTVTPATLPQALWSAEGGNPARLAHHGSCGEDAGCSVGPRHRRHLQELGRQPLPRHGTYSSTLDLTAAPSLPAPPAPSPSPASLPTSANRRPRRGAAGLEGGLLSSVSQWEEEAGSQGREGQQGRVEAARQLASPTSEHVAVVVPAVAARENVWPMKSCSF